MGRIDRFVTSSRRLRGASAARLGAALLAAGMALGGLGCDDESPGREAEDADLFSGGTGLDASVPGLMVLAFPEKSAFDLLLVIDDSPAMCEGQDALARNLDAHAADLAELATRSADLRVAVISTDLRHPERGGRFLNVPSPEALPEACAVGAAAVSLDCPMNEGAVINTADFVEECPVGDRECVAERLSRALRCRARVGVAGDAFGGGLEASRLALSCTGPNAALFGACCEGGVYNPGCEAIVGPGAPEFLRPDAVLGLVFVSARDDYSAPADNPTATLRGVCRPDGLDDLDASGLPAVYQDRRICPDTSADIESCAAVCAAPGDACDLCRRNATERACFVRDCGLPPCAAGERPEDGRCATAAACGARRCAIDRGNPSNCEWFRSNLTPVSDHYNFLVGLKARPREQLWVATVVGSRTDAAGSCHDWDVRPGGRYLELSELFDRGFSAGVGCPPGNEDDPAACVSICREDWAGALTNLREKIAQVHRSLCFDHPAACRVEGGGACATEAEREARTSYDFDFQWRCSDPVHRRGGCDLRRLDAFGNGEDCRVYDDEACVGGQRLDCDFEGIYAATLRLTYTPAAAAR